MRDAARERVDVVAVQELRMLPRELSAFCASARQLGYAVFAQPGPEVVGRWRESRAWAGVAMLVRNCHRCRVSSLVQGPGGQAVLVWINGSVVGSCYVAQNAEAVQFQADLVQQLLALHPQVRWALMGDWNCEPLQNSVLAALQRREARHLMVVDDDSVPLPTRWEGRRAIDYVVVHEACVAHRLRFHDLHYNDHKMICGRFQIPQLAHHTDWRLCGLARYSPPEGFCCNRWSSLLNDGWNASAQLPSLDNLTVETCDAWWAAAMAKLEEAFEYAWLVAREEIDPSRHHWLPKNRPKSSEPCFQAKGPVLRRPEGEQATNRLRCLRVLLNRLLALREHFVKDTLDSVEARNLVSKIQRCPYLPATQGHTARIQAVKSLIADAEKQQQDDKIRCWKNKLKDSATACFRWVRGPPAPISHMVCLGQDPSSDCLDGALAHLRDFWLTVWDRPLPDLNEQLRVCRGVLGDPVEPVVWDSLSPEALSAAAAAQRGSSAGLDGWSGDEVALVPQGVWAQLAPFFYACERLGTVPKAWTLIRQAHIPKSNKACRPNDSATPAENLRPISVMSVFWRLYASARLKSSPAVEWCASWMPADAWGGRKNADVYRAAAQVLGPVEAGGYLGSFDYSLAFDHVRPALVCALMQHLGMPVGLANSG